MPQRRQWVALHCLVLWPQRQQRLEQGLVPQEQRAQALPAWWRGMPSCLECWPGLKVWLEEAHCWAALALGQRVGQLEREKH